MSIDEYGKYLHGFNVIDCAVRSQDILYLLAREDYTVWPKSKWNSDNEPPPAEPHISKCLIPIMLRKQRSEVFSRGKYSGLGPAKIGTSTSPEEKCLIVTSLGQIYATGSGSSGFEEELKSYRFESGTRRGGIRKLRTIGGWLYACQGNRGVIKRLGKNHWQQWHDQIDDPPDGRFGFNDIDGYSEHDIYCVGEKGDVWHYDGNSWSQIQFPSNIDLCTVCCAGDGFVYISGEDGTTFKGRGQQWERLFERDMTLPFQDMVWYQDRVWATSDYGVWHIHQDQLMRAELPDGINAYSGHLAVADGVLMLAGYGGAAFLRDGQWTKIFSAGAMSREWKLRQTCG